MEGVLMEEERSPGSASADEEAAFAASRADRDETLGAIHRLEAAVEMAAPGRESEWLEQVVTDLRSLERAVATERDESSRPDSLLSMIARAYPRRFGSRVRQLREQFDDIGVTIASLRGQLESAPEQPVDFGDLRQRLGWLVAAMRHRRIREADLVFEALSLDFGAA
jgi:hypothetical protein